LCSYVLSECKQRESKGLYAKKDSWLTEMKSIYLKKKAK
jgi:adenylylsulfate kinase-like enzyme